MRGQRHTLAALYLGKDPVPVVQEAGWAPGPVWTSAENIAPTGIRNMERGHTKLLPQITTPKLPPLQSLLNSTHLLSPSSNSEETGQLFDSFHPPLPSRQSLFIFMPAFLWFVIHFFTLSSQVLYESYYYEV